MGWAREKAHNAITLEAARVKKRNNRNEEALWGFGRYGLQPVQAPSMLPCLALSNAMLGNSGSHIHLVKAFPIAIIDVTSNKIIGTTQV